MVAYFKPDPKGFAELAASDEIQQMAIEKAEAGAEYLRSIAPERTGAYEAGITVEPMPGWDGRAGAAIVVDVEHAAAVEWGTADTEAQHPLAQVADWIEGGDL